MAAFTGLAPTTSAQRPFELPRASPAASVGQTVGYTEIDVTYSRPAVRERAIWGGLVPYGKVWRAGANEATTFEIGTDVKIGGQTLPKGKYSLHVLPEEKAWTFIFNKQAEAWGSYAYDEKNDALRVKAEVSAAPMLERMTFGFENLTDTGATFFLHWEKRKASLPLVVESVETAKRNIREGLPKAKADDMFSWLGAARFYRQHGIDDKQAWEWLEKSLSIKTHYANLWEKSQWLHADGKKTEAAEWAAKALEAADKAGEAGMAATIRAETAAWKAAGAKKTK